MNSEIKSSDSYFTGEMKTDLSKYNAWYKPSRNVLVCIIWYYINALIFNSLLFPFNSLKIFILKLFGAKVGKGVVIKPNVNIKYPWLLEIGNHTWIGENVWIDNLALIKIGESCCLSQGAMLLTGNHNFTSQNFDLIVKPIILEDGVWIGAKSVVCPGVTCFSHSVLQVSSIATRDLNAYKIHGGNPANALKDRKIA
jgi:putative colanic acid biosynthesis acetyltransferase WcaF